PAHGGLHVDPVELWAAGQVLDQPFSLGAQAQGRHRKPGTQLPNATSDVLGTDVIHGCRVVLTIRSELGLLAFKLAQGPPELVGQPATPLGPHELSDIYRPTLS